MTQSTNKHDTGTLPDITDFDSVYHYIGTGEARAGWAIPDDQWPQFRDDLIRRGQVAGHPVRYFGLDDDLIIADPDTGPCVALIEGRGRASEVMEYVTMFGPQSARRQGTALITNAARPGGPSVAETAARNGGVRSISVVGGALIPDPLEYRVQMTDTEMGGRGREMFLRTVGAAVRGGAPVYIIDLLRDLPRDIVNRPGIAAVSRDAADHVRLLAAAAKHPGAVVASNGHDRLPDALIAAGVGTDLRTPIRYIARSTGKRPMLGLGTSDYVASVSGGRLVYSRNGDPRYRTPLPDPDSMPMPLEGDRTRTWLKLGPGTGLDWHSLKEVPLIALTDAGGDPIPGRSIYDPHSPDYLSAAEDQEGPTPRRTVRVPDAEWTAARAMAEATGETLAAALRRMLSDYATFGGRVEKKVYRATSREMLGGTPVVVEGLTGTDAEVRALFPAADWTVEYALVTEHYPL